VTEKSCHSPSLFLAEPNVATEPGKNGRRWTTEESLHPLLREVELLRVGNDASINQSLMPFPGRSLNAIRNRRRTEEHKRLVREKFKEAEARDIESREEEPSRKGNVIEKCRTSLSHIKGDVSQRKNGKRF